MALGNLLGLRTLPTGVALYMRGNPTPATAGGDINVGAITFTGGALGSQTAAGTIKYNWLNNSANTPVYSTSAVCGDGTVRLPSGLTPQPCTIMGVDRNLRTPYVSKWNLDIQHAITHDLSIDVAYVGNHGTKLVGLLDLNQAGGIPRFHRVQPGGVWPAHRRLTTATQTLMPNRQRGPLPANFRT